MSQQNTHFNMYIETSKQQQGSLCKNSHPKCFKTTNFDRFHCEYISQYIYIYIDMSIVILEIAGLVGCFAMIGEIPGKHSTNTAISSILSHQTPLGTQLTLTTSEFFLPALTHTS